MDLAGGSPTASASGESAKRKRGRPPKYESVKTLLSEVDPILLSPPGFSPMVASESATPTQKRGRGRPPGSGRKQKLASHGRKYLLKVPTQIDPLLKEPVITTGRKHLLKVPTQIDPLLKKESVITTGGMCTVSESSIDRQGDSGLTMCKIEVTENTFSHLLGENGSGPMIQDKSSVPDHFTHEVHNGSQEKHPLVSQKVPVNGGFSHFQIVLNASQKVEIEAPVTCDGTASPSQDCIVQAMSPTGGPLVPEIISSRDSSGAVTCQDISGSESDNDNDPEFCVDQPIAIGGDLEWVAVMYQAFVNLLQQVPGHSVGLSNRIMNSGLLVAQALKDCKMVGQMKEFTNLWKKAVKFARRIESAPALDQDEWFENFIKKQNKKIDKEIKNLQIAVEQYKLLKRQAAERVAAALHEEATVSSALADIDRRLLAELGEKEKCQADNGQILNDPSRRESLRQEVILHAESEFRQLAEKSTSWRPY